MGEQRILARVGNSGYVISSASTLHPGISPLSQFAHLPEYKGRRIRQVRSIKFTGSVPSEADKKEDRFLDELCSSALAEDHPDKKAIIDSLFEMYRQNGSIED